MKKDQTQGRSFCRRSFRVQSFWEGEEYLMDYWFSGYMWGLYIRLSIIQCYKLRPLLLLLHNVTKANPGLNQTLMMAVIHFISQRVDVNVHDIGPLIEFLIPCFLAEF